MGDDEQGTRPDDERPNLGSIFLGPKGENAEVLERLLLEALRDHVFWRRNFHPEDGFLIEESDKRSESFQRGVALLSQELLSLLGQLKAGVPFFSPRYIGHMSSDLTLASLVAYFATMLYNPNNVAAEASPVTTRLELEAADQLGAMVGYPAGRRWGHLTSGGTVANVEALWAARNVKYLTVAAYGAAQEVGLADVEVRLPDGRTRALGSLDLWALLNVEPGDALDLVDALGEAAEDGDELLAALGRHSLARLGYQEYARRLAADFGDPLPAGVVLVPSTAHYSWEKICQVLGLGSDQLLHVPVDRQFRMDPRELDRTLERLAAERRPVIACVAVVGTTEESAVDRVDLVIEHRRRAADLGLAFHLHADAAWGGYAASITRAADGSRRSYEEVLRDAAPEVWPREGVYRALCAVEETDSITIDPHKLGFVPYPAGAVAFRDRRARDLLAVEAPYLFHRGESAWGAIGRYILEGSKPGAAAAAVWMSHKVLPLDSHGYGRLICDASRGALALHRRLEGGEWGDFRLCLLPRPDLNIVCFALGHASFVDLAECNALVDRVYAAMSVGAGHPAPQLDYFVTKTVLRWEQYGESVADLVAGLGFGLDDCRRAGGVHVVRCTVMDPFLAERRAEVDHIEGFARCLRGVLEEQLTVR